MNVNQVIERAGEVQRRLADEKLRQLNDRFIAFLENTPDYVFIKDTQDRFQAASQALARVAGVPSWRDMLGRTAAEIYGKEQAAIIYDRAKLKQGDVIPGPAIVIEMDSTTLIETGCVATVDKAGEPLDDAFFLKRPQVAHGGGLTGESKMLLDVARAGHDAF